jgi:hypothetical protein
MQMKDFKKRPNRKFFKKTNRTESEATKTVVTNYRRAIKCDYVVTFKRIFGSQGLQ